VVRGVGGGKGTCIPGVSRVTSASGQPENESSYYPAPCKTWALLNFEQATPWMYFLLCKHHLK
jgi:hypothetical protein